MTVFPSKGEKNQFYQATLTYFQLNVATAMTAPGGSCVLGWSPWEGGV